MNKNLLLWDIYEISTNGQQINGVMLRGRIRKFAIENSFNVLSENTSDIQNGVRFAVLNSKDAEQVTEYVKTIIEGVTITLIRNSVPNPVLSKLQVNLEDRYKL